tara:strand:+ start:1699 stop:2397 length:699 start_codon:yes stop_codon:yes gene_type:complete
LGVGFVSGGWVVPDTPSTGSSLWSVGLGSNIYYDAGNVGVGTQTPNANLEVLDTTGATEVRVDTPVGIFDAGYSFYNNGVKEGEICLDDSQGDEIRFILGANTLCTGKDVFSMTYSTLEMGTSQFAFDTPTRWYRAPCCSSASNNFFELDDTIGTLPSVRSITNGNQGVRITVICSDDTSVIEEHVSGNIELSTDGTFDCSVVGIGSTIEFIYFDNAQHTKVWHEVSRSIRI